MIPNSVTIDKKNPEFLQNLVQNLYEYPPADSVDYPLSDLSPKDQKWDKHRTDTQMVAQIYHQTEFHKYYDRMRECANLLLFSLENGLTLKSAPFCRVRNCPTCQWRRSLRWVAMMHEAHEQLKQDYPTHRWLFLTLTVQNCHISELRDTLGAMNKAWKKLTLRKEFASVVGWIRTTEVTRDKTNPNTHAHPHFHIILMVKPSYFSHGYVKQMDWVRIWGECLGVDYLPNVDIRTVRPKNNDSTPITDAISETLKYAVKSSDMLGDGSICSQEWFLTYTKQVHKLRFVATGGVLKGVLSDDKMTNEEMLVTTGDDSEQTNEQDKRRMAFTYRPTKSKYLYAPYYNT